MTVQNLNKQSVSVRDNSHFWSAPLKDKGIIVALTEAEITEVKSFLNIRPVHTVVMASFIHDNGIVSELNRGTFYAYRNCDGRLEGVALIGHSTLIEARTDQAMFAFA